jgi:hypothetical protein
MIKNKTDKAYKVFKRIASSNKRTVLNELETIKPTSRAKKNFKMNEVMPMATILSRVDKESEVKRQREAGSVSTEQPKTVYFLFLM